MNGQAKKDFFYLVEDTCTFDRPSTNNMPYYVAYLVKGKFYISSMKGDFEEDKCTRIGHLPAKIRNYDDFEVYEKGSTASFICLVFPLFNYFSQ